MNATIRPSLKTAVVLYGVAAGTIIATLLIGMGLEGDAFFEHGFSAPFQALYLWFALPLWFLGLAVSRHIRALSTRLVISDQTLLYKRGKVGRPMKIDMVREISLNQTPGQRILRVGDPAIKIVASSDPFTITDVPRPQEVKKAILEASKASGTPA